MVIVLCDLLNVMIVLLAVVTVLLVEVISWLIMVIVLLVVVTVLPTVVTVLLYVDRYIGCIGGCDDTLVELFDLHKTMRRNSQATTAGEPTTCLNKPLASVHVYVCVYVCACVHACVHDYMPSVIKCVINWLSSNTYFSFFSS